MNEQKDKIEEDKRDLYCHISLGGCGKVFIKNTDDIHELSNKYMVKCPNCKREIYLAHATPKPSFIGLKSVQ